MVAAAANECGLTDVEIEVVAVANAADQVVELGGGYVVHGAAPLTDEMAVCTHEMEERLTVRVVNSLDEPPLAQRIECPVHRRKMNFWMRVMQTIRKIVGAQVLLRVRKEIDHHPTSSCYAVSVGAQRVQHAQSLLSRHLLTPSFAQASCICKVFASDENSGFRETGVLECASEFVSGERVNMEPTSRRQFLKRGSAVAAAAGVAATVPASAARALSSGKSRSESDPPLPDDESVDVPVVAHVRDVRKGLVTLYTGEREITIKDRRLAAALYRATH
jgi:hypothetical protein